MWSVWLVFYDCGFHSVCPLMKRIRGLWKFPDERDYLWGKLGFVLMGGAMFSESLIQFSADRCGWVPSLLFSLRQNFQPMPLPETPEHSKASLAQSPTASKVKFPRGSQLDLLDSQVGKSVLGPRTFLPVWEFLFYNCSAVCMSCAQWLYGGANGDLLHEAHATRWVIQVCHSQSLFPPQTTLTRTCARDTQTIKGKSGSVSVAGTSGSWWAQDFAWVLQTSLASMGLDYKCNFAPPTILLGLLLCPWNWDIFFLVDSNILLSMVVQQLVATLEFTQEKMSTKPFTLLSCLLMSFSS